MRVMVALVAVLVTALVGGAAAPPAEAAGPDAVVAPGCPMTTLPRTDDDSTGLVPLGFTIDFFGTAYSSLYVNNNGNVTFDAALAEFTPFGLTSTNTKIIAPFFGDVDTRNADSGEVTYGACTFDGRPAFFANWAGVGVGYFSARADKLNIFQLILVDRSDAGAGDFDIVFNYDQVQWETGDASGGSGGIGGSPARVGFSNGVGTSFELPGSGVSLAFLDTNTNTGLIWNSLNSGGRLGRYRFAVRNGSVPTGHEIEGTVFHGNAVPGNEVAGALVEICSAAGSCNLTSTGATGRYSVGGLGDGTYDVRAFPPGDLNPGRIGPLELTGADLLNQHIVVSGPAPPPPGTSIDDSPAGAIPVLIVGQPANLVTTGCDGGAAAYTVTGEYGGSIGGPMTEGPAGTYRAVVVVPFNGPATVTIEIEGCPTTEFTVYVDASAVVRTPGGSPIAGATVTLLRSDTGLPGTFDAVPDGSPIMSLSNRANPDLTNANGHFGWDVVTGLYVVRAEKADCHAVGDPGRPFVETEVLPVPPIWADLDLRLEGPGCPDELGAEAMLAELLAAVIGVGPGKSLENKVRAALASLAAGDIGGACEILVGFRDEVRAQSGKKVPAALAAELRATAAEIMAVLGC